MTDIQKELLNEMFNVNGATALEVGPQGPEI